MEYKNYNNEYHNRGISLYEMDCMELMKQTPNKYYSLCIVDPPYFNSPQKHGYYGANVSSIGVVRGGYKTIGSWEVPKQDYFDEIFRVSEHQIIWGVNYFDIRIKKIINGQTRYVNVGPGRIIWDKCNGKSSFSDCEIAYCSKHDSTRLFRYMWNGMMQGKSISEGWIQQGDKKLNETRIHPTQKSIKLYNWLLKNYASPGQRILDTHGGSFSSAIAAHYFGCDFVGCEIDPIYYAAAVKRFDKETRQLAMF